MSVETPGMHPYERTQQHITESAPPPPTLEKRPIDSFQDSLKKTDQPTYYFPSISYEGSASEQLERHLNFLNILDGTSPDLKNNTVLSDNMKGFTHEDIKSHMTLAEDSAKQVYADRGMLSKVRDALSFIFGKSDATKAYENFTKAHSLFKDTLQSVDDIEQVFGSGVKITNEQKKQWVSLLNIFPVAKRSEVISELKQALSPTEEDAGSKTAIASQRLLLEANEAGINPDDQRFKLASSLLNILQEHVSPKVFNTQFAREYLPKQFMSEQDRKDDGELLREQGPINSARTFIDALPDSDSRKARFNDMIKEGNMAGFERGTNMEIAAGNIPGVSVDRLYGIKRTPEGFTSVLGLGQGDRHAVGIDKMPWPHKTTKEQNATIMKILRSTEKAATTDGKVVAFESAYDNKDNNYKLDAEQKNELKTAILQFAQARETRLDQQMAAIKTTESAQAYRNLSRLEQTFPNSYISPELTTALTSLAKYPEASTALEKLLNASQKAKTEPEEFNAAFIALEDAVEKLNKGQAITSDEYKLIRNLYNGPIKRKLTLTNTQFHTDSIQTLLAPNLDSAEKLTGSGAKAKRLYNSMKEMNALLDGKNEDGEAIAPQLVEQLKSQTENAKKTASDAGYGDTGWFAQDDPALGYLVHSNWINASIPKEGEPADFKATRTLGLAQGDKAQVGAVNLDFSKLGPIKHEQAKTLMAAVQDFAEYAPSSRKSLPAEKENFLTNIVAELKDFTKDQKTLIVPIIKIFVEACATKINELHSNLNQ